MAIRRRNIGSVSRKSIGAGGGKLISKQVVDYSEPYTELMSKAQNSNQLVDPFNKEYSYSVGGRQLLEPLYGFDKLLQIFIESTMLRQCIESYVINIESYGYVLEYIGDPVKKSSKESLGEYSRLTAFLESAAHSGASLTDVRKHSRSDYEVLGNRAFEIARNEDGEVVLLDHAPAASLRMTKRDTVPTRVMMEVQDPLDPKNTTKVEVKRYFRRFVQKNQYGAKVYFKEFGDPRRIDPETGEENNLIAVEDAATEILYDSQYVPGQVYGLPRWVGQLPAILGSKEADLVNFNFFKDNAIPAMAVLVSNGALTQESFDKLDEYFTSIKGQKSMNRIVVLEAVPDDSNTRMDQSQPAPRVDMKPLISERQQDGLFQEYDRECQRKIRSAFRLPPIFLGLAEDYTRASAVASMLTAEGQVFAPERIKFDLLMNRHILSTHKPSFWRFQSLGAPISDGETLTKMLDSLGAQGALTPNVVIKIANQFLDISIESITAAWGDVPFDIILNMVKGGQVIEGLDDFLKDVSAASDAPPVKPAIDGEPSAAKKIQSELKSIVQDAEEALNNGAYEHS